MRKRLLWIDLALILSLGLDYRYHYLPLKVANVIFFIALGLTLYLFKPYFIWSDLTKRQREMTAKKPDNHDY